MNGKIKSALILAAGKGIRLGNLAEGKPKGFLEVDGVSLIKRSIDNLKAEGFTDIVIVTGHLKSYYEEFAKQENIRCVFNEKYNELGSAYSFFVGFQEMRDDFILLESDLLYDRNMLKELSRCPLNTILISPAKNIGDDVYVEDFAGLLNQISKDSAKVKSTENILVGISSFSYELVKNFLTPFTEGLFYEIDDINKKMEYEHLLVLSRNYMLFKVYKTKYQWCEIDNAEHLEYAIKNILPNI
jgi:2-aminoethylphosphonate-pyruvate transaminase